jgi:hypothetical protein
MNRVDARRLRKGDCVLIHTSQFLFLARHSRWVKGKVVEFRNHPTRPDVPDVLVRLRCLRKPLSCTAHEFAPRRPETWVKFLVGSEIRTLVTVGTTHDALVQWAWSVSRTVFTAGGN